MQKNILSLPPNKMLFSQLDIISPILKALDKQGYTQPTPIQEQAIPHILNGEDILATAQTGTGKTAAFAIPTLQILSRGKELSNKSNEIKTLILTPTRELAIQIEENFAEYGAHLGLKRVVIFGWIKQHSQVRKLESGVDILIATPGRLLDLMNQGYVNLKHIEIFTLDEADRMLHMGFINDVKKIIKSLPEKKQTLLFSATMPKEIASLADSLLESPARVSVAPVSSTADTVQQSVYHVTKSDKKYLLSHILKNKEITALLVFSRTKHGANRIAADLDKSGITAEAIHGNKTQNARQRALNNFKSGSTRVLVATDIAARGIDIDDLQYVLNYDIPNESETYVHRIWRTGRAGNSGQAFSFCNQEEYAYLVDVEKLIGKEIPVIDDQPYHSPINPNIGPVKKKPAPKKHYAEKRATNPNRKRNVRRKKNKRTEK